MAALSAFDAISSRYGLEGKEMPHRPHAREFGVSFDGTSVRLRVRTEVFNTPWVEVGRRGGRTFGLHELLDLRAPELVEAQPKRSDPLNVAMVQLAKLTLAVASDFLEGDFSAFDALRAARTVRIREQNQVEWGTATGESPRFTERPTLKALFSDAANPGIIEARVYQAVWDWHYSLTEIGTHLGESPETVQVHHDRWERIDD